MAKSNKPIFWGLFAAGGTLTAFLFPAVIVLTLMAAVGSMPEALSYAQMHAFATGGWLDGWIGGKGILFVVVLLSLWHSAHRMRITLHDFGARADGLISTVLYVLAALGTIGAIVFLLRI